MLNHGSEALTFDDILLVPQAFSVLPSQEYAKEAAAAVRGSKNMGKWAEKPFAVQ